MAAALRTVSQRNRVSPRYNASPRYPAKLSIDPSYTIAAHANYRREDFIFPRTQSLTMREARWERRVKPIRSWSEIVGAAALIGVASMALALSSTLI